MTWGVRRQRELSTPTKEQRHAASPGSSFHGFVDAAADCSVPVRVLTRQPVKCLSKRKYTTLPGMEACALPQSAYAASHPEAC